MLTVVTLQVCTSELKQIFPQHTVEYKERFHTKLEAMLFLAQS